MGPNITSGSAPRATVMTPLAAPNAMANSAATNGDAPTNASMAKAKAVSVTAPRAIQSGWVRPAVKKSTSRAATCAGPNSAPTATTVAASLPPRCSIASRFDVTPERMKKCSANAATSRMNGQPSGRIGTTGKAVELDTAGKGATATVRGNAKAFSGATTHASTAAKVK